ncbi:serine protease Do [Ereboglobus sp. PH5-10]|uniref:S1C family serine protease n=1 Tax=Ereboglobus sp. PH5-10 TaxID=2940629 RepID=UPI002407037E|nr:trypsin-like peptidase domain-containing protein [Ereboglobus sp. PH5-10]MDF9827449.1 serine protease Do [Ereboglobus sp. PH5-10]
MIFRKLSAPVLAALAVSALQPAGFCAPVALEESAAESAPRAATSSKAVFAPPRPSAFSLGRVRLKNGSAIQGDIIAERADRVIVDLGFDVVAIPRDDIDSVTTEAAGDFSDNAETETGDSALFRTAPNQPALTVKENVSRVGEAVVQIRTPTGLGSGFIIDPAGYIVTNQHVIAGEYNISVTLFRSGRNELEKVVYHKIRIVALDPRLDLALLKIEDLSAAVTLPALPLGDSNTLNEGQTVFAIGSPLGLDRTVSQGIVSSRNRPLGGQLYIQTTTQINPGNSGGPLFNLQGEVVGVNNMKPMITGVEGLGFSIPAAVLKNFLRNRDAYAFDARNPNSGYRYLEPPRILKTGGTANPEQ